MSFSSKRPSVIVRKNCPIQNFRFAIQFLLHYPRDFIFASRSHHWIVSSVIASFPAQHKSKYTGKKIYHHHIETNLSMISQIYTYTIMHLFDFADSWAVSPQMKFAPEKPKFETTRSRAQSSHDDHGQQRRRSSESLLLVENPVFALQNEKAFFK